MEVIRRTVSDVDATRPGAAQLRWLRFVAAEPFQFQRVEDVEEEVWAAPRLQRDATRQHHAPHRAIQLCRVVRWPKSADIRCRAVLVIGRICLRRRHQIQNYTSKDQVTTKVATWVPKYIFLGDIMRSPVSKICILETPGNYIF